MLEENVFLLLCTANSEYDKFIVLLKQRFNNVDILCQRDSVFSSIKKQFVYNSLTESSVIVIFVEHPFLEEISSYLTNNVDNLNYILISYYYHDIDSIGNSTNVFDFINTSKFDMNFFYSKLINEIESKKKIYSLNYEVKEFYEIGKSLSFEKDTVKLLDMIISSSMNLTSSDAGTIYLVIDKQTFNWTSIKDNDYTDKILKFVIAKNASIDVNLETYTSPISRESIFGYSVITGETLRIEDAYNLSNDVYYKHNNSFDIHTGYVTKSILSIPMKDHENNILGVIQLINKKKNKMEKIDYSNCDYNEKLITFNSSDELIMNSLAGQAAVVLENSLLYCNMKELLESYKKQNFELEVLSKKILIAHEEERKRIARDIHDGPAQAVVNLSLKIELSKKYLQNAMYEKALDEMDNLNSSIKSTSKEIRTILYDLKPSYLETGVITALENRCNIFEENTGIKIHFSASGDDTNMEYYLSSTIYRMVQESLSNIHKHAKANNINISFDIDETRILVVVTDDGIGFEVDEVSKKNRSISGGFGLDGLRERAALIKGKVDIKSVRGTGTSITIFIPI